MKPYGLKRNHNETEDFSKKNRDPKPSRNQIAKLLRRKARRQGKAEAKNLNPQDD